jgi:hypothetical protein
MSDGEAVQQWLRAVPWVEVSRSEVEASPTAVAVPYSAEPWILGSYVASACQNLGRASFARVRSEILIEIQLWPRRLTCGEDVRW